MRRRVASRALLVLGTVLAVLAILASWVRGQVLDGNRYLSATTEIVAEPAVQQATAAYLADQLMTAPGLRPALEERLPGPTKALAGPLTGIVGDGAERAARRALASGAFQQLWRSANALTYRQLEAIAQGRRESGVVLDLRPLLGKLATRVGFGERVVASLPPDRGIIRILTPQDVKEVRGGVRALKGATFLLTLLALLSLAGGIALAPARAGGVAAAGTGLLVAGVLLLVARRVVGNQVISDLTANGTAVQAGRESWWILTAYLADVAGSVAVLGTLLLAGGWLAGPTAAAARVRTPLARLSASHPGFIALAAFFVVIALLAAGALPWAGSPLAAAIYLLLGASVVPLLRRARPGSVAEPA